MQSLRTPMRTSCAAEFGLAICTMWSLTDSRRRAEFDDALAERREADAGRALVE